MRIDDYGVGLKDWVFLSTFWPTSAGLDRALLVAAIRLVQQKAGLITTPTNPILIIDHKGNPTTGNIALEHSNFRQAEKLFFNVLANRKKGSFLNTDNHTDPSKTAFSAQAASNSATRREAFYSHFRVPLATLVVFYSPRIPITEPTDIKSARHRDYKDLFLLLKATF